MRHGILVCRRNLSNIPASDSQEFVDQDSCLTDGAVASLSPCDGTWGDWNAVTYPLLDRVCPSGCALFITLSRCIAFLAISVRCGIAFLKSSYYPP